MIYKIYIYFFQRARVAEPAPGTTWAWVWARPARRLLGDLTEPRPQLPHQRDGQASRCAPTPTSVSAEGWRAMKPQGGASSDLFGSPEEGVPSSRPNRMASTIFGPTEEPQNIPKRTNPPGTGLGDSFVLWPLPVFELLFCVYTHTHRNPFTYFLVQVIPCHQSSRM